MIMPLLAQVTANPTMTGYDLKKYDVGGEPGWRLHQSRSRHAPTVRVAPHGNGVLDADSGKLLGHIADTPGVHGIALATEFGKGFVGNGQLDTISVIDLKTLRHIAELKAGKKSDAIVYDPRTRKVIVANAEATL
jgi:DNA-binding beta-propeller fold protein YncE